jgi:hypothetical protein
MSRSRLLVYPAQGGAAAVEFAVVSLLFFTFLFGIFEFGRMMYVHNTMQEVTRRAARAAVIRWIDQADAIKSIALFGSAAIPAGAEVTADDITIEYLNQAGGQSNPLPTDPSDNLSACGDAGRTSSCIFSVRVSINGVRYSPMLSLFSFLDIALPSSSVTMHAESMGFEVNF